MCPPIQHAAMPAAAAQRRGKRRLGKAAPRNVSSLRSAHCWGAAAGPRSGRPLRSAQAGSRASSPHPGGSRQQPTPRSPSRQGGAANSLARALKGAPTHPRGRPPRPAPAKSGLASALATWPHMSLGVISSCPSAFPFPGRGPSRRSFMICALAQPCRAAATALHSAATAPVAGSRARHLPTPGRLRSGPTPPCSAFRGVRSACCYGAAAAPPDGRPGRTARGGSRASPPHPRR